MMQLRKLNLKAILRLRFVFVRDHAVEIWGPCAIWFSVTSVRPVHRESSERRPNTRPLTFFCNNQTRCLDTIAALSLPYFTYFAYYAFCTGLCANGQGRSETNFCARSLPFFALVYECLVLIGNSIKFDGQS